MWWCRRSLAPCHGQCKYHQGYYAGEAQTLGSEPHAEGDHELHDDEAGRIVDTPHHRVGQPCQQPAGNDAAADHDGKHGYRIHEAEAAGQDGAHCQPVDQQRGSVVEETFTFQHHADAMRRIHLLHDSQRCDRIGRRQYRPEGDGGGQGKFRKQQMHGDGYARRGQCHRDQHQQQDLHAVAAQVAQRSVEGGVQQHRRDKQGKDDVGDTSRRGMPGMNAAMPPPTASTVG